MCPITTLAQSGAFLFSLSQILGAEVESKRRRKKNRRKRLNVKNM
jgi:hypothetical protein